VKEHGEEEDRSVLDDFHDPALRLGQPVDRPVHPDVRAMAHADGEPEKYHPDETASGTLRRTTTSPISKTYLPITEAVRKTDQDRDQRRQEGASGIFRTIIQKIRPPNDFGSSACAGP
jgi:hypothetical protein